MPPSWTAHQQSQFGCARRLEGMAAKLGSRIFCIRHTALGNMGIPPCAALHLHARESPNIYCRGRQNGHNGGNVPEASRPQDADKIDFSWCGPLDGFGVDSTTFKPCLKVGKIIAHRPAQFEIGGANATASVDGHGRYRFSQEFSGLLCRKQHTLAKRRWMRFF